MNFYVAGYYLIQGSSKPDWMDKKNILPDTASLHHLES
jgi:hypothetical protein